MACRNGSLNRVCVCLCAPRLRPCLCHHLLKWKSHDSSEKHLVRLTDAEQCCVVVVAVVVLIGITPPRCVSGLYWLSAQWIKCLSSKRNKTCSQRAANLTRAKWTPPSSPLWKIYCLKSIKVSLSLSSAVCVCLSSWDDSSSVSSGISDNIDTDDINTSSSISSYANTPAAQRKGLSTQVIKTQ